MPIRSGDTAPYAPPATIMHVVNTFRDRGMTAPIAPDVLLRAGVGESLVPRTLRSLEGLELIDEQGNPTAAFEGLRRASSDELRQRLEAIVRSVYAEVFQFTDPAKDDVDRVADAFRAYEPIGQRGRMVTLFLGLCEAAGIIPESTRRASATARPAIAKKVVPKRVTDSHKNGSGEAPHRGIHTGAVPPAIAGLFASLPPDGRGWTQAQRDKWVKIFETVLDFAIPIDAAPTNAKDEAEDDE